jgi:hypothetical protein
MGRMPAAEREPLGVHVTEDGRILVHVGTRFVEASLDELDRTVARLAAEGGSVLYSRDDPAEEPGAVAIEVVGLLTEHEVPWVRRDAPIDELDDAGL